MTPRRSGATPAPADEHERAVVDHVQVDRVAITKARAQLRKKPIDEALCSRGVLKGEDLEFLRALRERDLAEVRARLAPGVATAALGFAVLAFSGDMSVPDAIGLAPAWVESVAVAVAIWAPVVLQGLGIACIPLGGVMFGYAGIEERKISRQLDRIDERRTRPQPPANPSCSRYESRRRPVCRMKVRISD